jgi:hypothetical protein
VPQPDAVEQQPAGVDRSGAASLKGASPPTTTGRPFGLEDMASVELAVLITARDRNERQALEAAAVIAARGAWRELDDAAEILCRSYEPDEQLLGLRLIRRCQTVDPTMRQALIGLVRYLARHADPSVAALAQDVLDEMANGG